MKKFASYLLTIGLILGSGVALAGPAQAADKIRINLVGGFKGFGETRKEARNSCYSEDFRQGSRVKIMDGDGKVVGLGKMKWKRVGKVTDNFLEDPEYYTWDDIIRFEVDCVLTTRVRVDNARFYDISIDRKEAGTYSRSELREDNWILNLTWN